MIATSPISVAADVIAQATAQAGRDIGLDVEDQDDLAGPVHRVVLVPAARKGIDMFMTAWYTSLADPMEMYGVLRTGEFSNYGAGRTRSSTRRPAKAIADPLDDPDRTTAMATRRRSRRAAALAAAVHAADRRSGSATGSPASRRRSTTCTTRGPRPSGPRADERSALPAARSDGASSSFERRELSPVELLDAVVTRTDEVEEPIDQRADRADARRGLRRRARVGGAVRARPTAPRGRWKGSRSLLKEEQPIAGRTIEEGSLLEKGNVADVTHPVVSGSIFAAGAVVHGRTTTPEFSCAPVHALRAVGSHAQPVEHRDDTRWLVGRLGCGAGSRRDDPRDRLRHRWLDPDPVVAVRRGGLQAAVRPGARDGAVQLRHLLRRRPMGRSVADVALLQNVLAGPHPHDQASLRPAYVLPDQFDDVTRAAGGPVRQPR